MSIPLVQLLGIFGSDWLLVTPTALSTLIANLVQNLKSLTELHIIESNQS